MSKAQLLHGQEIRVSDSLYKRARWFVIKWTTVSTVVVTGVVYGSYQVVNLTEVATTKVQQLVQDVRERLTLIQVRREFIKSDAVPLPDVVRQVAARHGIPYIVLKAVVEQESSDGAFVYRFEADTYNKLKAKQPYLPDSEIRMLASSHGVAQVMGFNAETRCGIHWSKLYDVETGLDCGAQILKENLVKHENQKDISKRVRLALRDYNGSGKEAEQYADEVMGLIGAKLLSDSKVLL